MFRLRNFAVHGCWSFLFQLQKQVHNIHSNSYLLAVSRAGILF